MLDLLRHEDFRRVWLCGTLTGILRWLEMLAISLFVLERTGSPFAVAVFTFIRLAPLLLFGLAAGVMGDRYNRRRLLQGNLAALSVASFVLAALAATGQIALWQVGVGTFLSGLLHAVDFPFRRTLAGEFAGPGRLGTAMSLEAATANATRLVGPAAGGLLFQLTSLPGVFVVAGCMYGLAFALVWPITAPLAPGRLAGQSLVGALAEGWAITRASRVIVAALAVTVIVNFWGFAFMSLVPVIGERVLHLTASMIGVLMAAEGLGAMIGSILVGAWGRPRQYARIYLGSSAVFLASVLAFGLSGWFPTSLVILLLCGISLAGFSVMQSTIVLLAAPAAARARVMGVLTVCIGSGPLGMLHVGLLANLLGSSVAVTVIAAEGLVALAASALIWPELRRAADWALAQGAAPETFETNRPNPTNN